MCLPLVSLAGSESEGRVLLDLAPRMDSEEQDISIKALQCVALGGMYLFKHIIIVAPLLCILPSANDSYLPG